MGEKISFKDIPTLLKESKKAKTLAIFALVVLVLAMLVTSPSPRKKRARVNKAPVAPMQSQVKIANNDSYNDLLTAFQQQIAQTQEQTEQNRAILEELRTSQIENDKQTAEILRKMLARVDAIEAVQQQTTQYSPQTTPIEAGADAKEITDSLETFGEINTKKDAVTAPIEPKKLAFIGAGDSVRVKLLAGVNAPTDGTPYPVVFKLTGDIIGPDGSALPLGEARLIAAAQGSLTDSRALFRLTKLNIRLPNGKRKVVDVDGWIVGEDGIRGMQGILIDPIGKAIGAATIGGGIQGIGQGLAMANSSSLVSADGTTQTFITGDTVQFAAGRAASSAASEWNAILKQRISELVPVVQVYSGREATAVFSTSVSIDEVFDLLEDDNYVFASLD